MHLSIRESESESCLVEVPLLQITEVQFHGLHGILQSKSILESVAFPLPKKIVAMNLKTHIQTSFYLLILNFSSDYCSSVKALLLKWISLNSVELTVKPF